MKTILIVEDDKHCGMYMERVLEKKYETKLVKNPEESILQLQIGKIDLILLDIVMPGMDGFDVLQKIKEIDENVPVVTQTAYNSERSKELIMSLGSNDYILKPFSPQELLEIVEKNIR